MSDETELPVAEAPLEEPDLAAAVKRAEEDGVNVNTAMRAEKRRATRGRRKKADEKAAAELASQGTAPSVPNTPENFQKIMAYERAMAAKRQDEQRALKAAMIAAADGVMKKRKPYPPVADGAGS